MTSYRLTLTTQQRDELLDSLGDAGEFNSEGFELARKTCREPGCEDDEPCVDCGAWSQAITQAEELTELVRFAEPLCHCGAPSTEPDENAEPTCDACLEAERTEQPACGHSACRQNWIDTGESFCVETTEDETSE